MTENIVSLHDRVNPEIENKVSESVVNALAEALEAAKRGEITSIAFVTVDPAGNVQNDYVCGAGQRHDLIAGCCMLQWIATKRMAED